MRCPRKNENSFIIMPELFSDTWALAWRDSINRSNAYRTSGASWTWPLLVRVDDGPSFRLDLRGGQCHSIECLPPATVDDEASAVRDAPFILGGPREEWERVLSGDCAPLVAVMQGRLRLEKGSLLKLSRYTGAARDLLGAAVAVTGDPSPNAPGPDTSEPNVPARATAAHMGFRTTSQGGLQGDDLPMQLYHKAKKLGIWDPAGLDMSRDASDWMSLSTEEQDVLLRLVAMFQAGEEAVTLDLLPLMTVIAREGRTEETMYLTTFLFEEAKHTEFFRRVLDTVGSVDARAMGDLSAYHTPSYRKLFYEELPAALNRLDGDPSPAAQVHASTTYNMVVEGTLAETGYHALYTVLDSRSILPGLREGIGLLQRDESRHIAYGVHLLTRLLAADPSLVAVFERRMEDLLPLATASISELFACYDPMPFGLREEDFVQFAMDQFGKRARRIVTPTAAT